MCTRHAHREDSLRVRPRRGLAPALILTHRLGSARACAPKHASTRSGPAMSRPPRVPEGATPSPRRATLPKPVVTPGSRAKWRAWLSAHHGRSTGVWLVLRTRPDGRKTLSPSDAVEEALCFGWIDSTLRRIGEGRSALRFTPRRAKSPWATSNKRRIRSLTARGLMRAPGLRAVERAKGDGSWTALDSVERLRVPPDLARALAAVPAATRNFAALTPSARKSRLWWIESAKRPATRARRISETVRNAAPQARRVHRP